MNHINFNRVNLNQKRSPLVLALTVAALAAGTLIMCRGADVRESVTASLYLCYKYLIPSLLPFLSIGGIIVSTEAGDLLGAAVGRPLAALFGISREGAVCVLLGVLSGMPVGARCAVGLYTRGRITADEAERITAFASLPSPAFVILAVGGGMLGSVALGARIWLCALALNLIYGVILGVTARKRGANTSLPLAEDGGKSMLGGNSSPLAEKPSITGGIVEALRDASIAMVVICGFVCVLGALGAVIFSLLPSGTPDFMRIIISGLLEITSGANAVASGANAVANGANAVANGANAVANGANAVVNGAARAAVISAPRMRLAAMSAVVSWSGLCAHLQSAAFMSPAKLSMRRFYIGRIITTACAVTAAMV